MVDRENILTPQEIQEIQDEIAQLFYQEGKEILNIDLIALKNEINQILNQLKLNGIVKNQWIVNSTGEIKEHKIYDQRQDQILFAKAYLILFKLRTFLLGEEINYRYYFIDKITGKSKVIQFNEDNLLHFISLGKSQIDVANTILMDLKNTDQVNQLNNLDLYELYATQHYDNLMSGWRPYKRKATGIKEKNAEVNDYFVKKKKHELYFVRSSIMAQYGKKNPGLGTPSHHTSFNRGNIFESMDISVTDAFYQEPPKHTIFLEVIKLFFGKYLKHDNIKALKGGDNPFTNTSIKATEARIQKYSTIINALEDIYNLLNLRTKSEIIEWIKKLMMDSSKFNSAEEFNDSAKLAADTLIDVLETNKNYILAI